MVFWFSANDSSIEQVCPFLQHVVQHLKSQRCLKNNLYHRVQCNFRYNIAVKVQLQQGWMRWEGDSCDLSFIEKLHASEQWALSDKCGSQFTMEYIVTVFRIPVVKTPIKIMHFTKKNNNVQNTFAQSYFSVHNRPTFFNKSLLDFILS